MDFRFTDEQRMLREAARHFVKEECASDFVRRMEADETGYSRELWRKMAGLGWMGLMLPERYGGLGLGLLDLAVIMEEIGAGCVPGPFVSTVLGSLAILAGGGEERKAELLPKVACGDLVLALAYLEPGSVRYEPAYVTVNAARRSGGFVLNGAKLFVTDAHVADHLVVTARTSGPARAREGISVFLVPREVSGLALTRLATIAGDQQFEVTLDGVEIDRTTLLGDVDRGWKIMDRILPIGALAKCAEMVGGAQKVLDMTVGYAKERMQFGKPIGTFQAVQHHCANMAMDLDGSRYITYKAAWMLSEGRPCDLLVASAKGWTSDAYRRICALGHQIGAATAYVVEHDMTLYSRRAKAAELAFGDAAYHRRQAAAALGL